MAFKDQINVNKPQEIISVYKDVSICNGSRAGFLVAFVCFSRNFAYMRASANCEWHSEAICEPRIKMIDTFWHDFITTDIVNS